MKTVSDATINEDYSMKDCISVLVEKPFSCDIDGCSMKFTNEDHLTVHKKRHGMVLNLGIGPKGNTFSDQTPTPTRFIRNCEEVGLFQDLQNVNPFEETFKRAVEAVKTGQTPLLDKSFQTNPPDDTLHTPNVFPHITDLPCVNQSENLVTQDNKQPPSDTAEEIDSKNLGNNDKELPLRCEIEPKKLILGSVSHRKRKNENKSEPAVIKVQSDNYGLAIKPVKEEPCQGNTHMLSDVSISKLNKVQGALKEKLKNNIQNKQIPIVLQLKVPIPKSTYSGPHHKSQMDKFSTFSKNSLKFESKLAKPQSGIFDLTKKAREKKNYSGLPKERIEILERNRAAATRCREKKKIYVSYLEKLNRDLTDANKKLQLHNMSLKKQIAILQTELLKHQNCNLSNSNRETEASLTNKDMTSKDGSIETPDKVIVEHTPDVSGSSKKDVESISVQASDDAEKETTVFDTVEVCFTDNCFDSSHKNSVYLDSNEPVSNSNNSMKTNCEGKNLRKAYTDHSYFNYSNTTVTQKRSINTSVMKPKLTSAVLTRDTKHQSTNKDDDDSLLITLPQGDNSIFRSLNSGMVVNVLPQQLILQKPPK